MLSDETIAQRLNEMASKPDPINSKWPENCAGSRRALVIFLGPSPGGKKEKDRRPIKLNFSTPLWNNLYLGKVDRRRGFEARLKEIAAALFDKSNDEPLKLIARFNLDWLQNPKSEDVPYQYMWKGRKYVIPVIMECEPELIIPMDMKSFIVLQIALCEKGFNIKIPEIERISIKRYENNTKTSFHRDLMAFKATKGGNSILVVKSWQHPSRIFNSDYAKRIGEGIRSAAEQMEKDQVVNISF